MKTFNSNTFINSLKKEYGEISNPQGDNAAKTMVADSIISNGFSPDDVLSFIFKEINRSGSLDKADWNKIFSDAIKKEDEVSKNLAVLRKPLKKNFSDEEIFSMAVSGCGKNPDSLKDELYIDKYGWLKVVEKLVAKATEEAVVKTVKKSIEPKKKESSIKTIKVDPRRKSITLKNKKTDEVKTWDSYRACEIEIFKDPKKGHGTVSQLVSGKVKSILGTWMLYKEEKTVSATPVILARHHGRNKSIIQHLPDGTTKVWSSITEAAKVTSICRSSICKSVNGVKGYESAGGFKWGKYEEAAA